MRMGAEIQDGAVLVARAILNSSLWTMRAADKVVAITCIAIASWKDGKWFDGVREIPVLRGQFVRSWAGLADSSGESIQTVRTAVQHLENVGFLTRKSTGRYHIFTIPKYSHYQDLTKYSDSIAAKSNRIPNSPLTGTQQDANNIQEGNKGRREEGEEDTSPSSPFGMLLAKARAQHIPGKPDTLRSYFLAWVARTNYTKTEQMIMDPWSKGKTVLEMHDHFFPKLKDGLTQKEFTERRDGAYRKV